ncbi:hypothetical protein Ancab_011653 [Ancistrocladus abbreviatus]
MLFSSGLGILLSLVFGCLLLALVAELYYLLWWKKLRINSRRIDEDDYTYTTHAKELFYLFCWNKQPTSSIHNTSSSNHEISTILTDPEANSNDPDVELGSSRDLLLKALGEDGVDSEIMGMHGPPRFLFTIKEETKEDLESDDGKSKGDNRSRKGSRTRSLSDLILAVETPFLSPLSSPPLKASTLSSYSLHGFNPLFESSVEAELNRIRSSPPPKFKFLRDAEEKLYRRLLEEAEKMKISQNSSMKKALGGEEEAEKIEVSEANGSQNSASMEMDCLKDESFVKVVVGKSKEREVNQQQQHHHLPLLQQQCHSNCSQILPLASSPTSFRPIESKPGCH